MTKKQKVLTVIFSALLLATLLFIWINSCLPKASSSSESSKIYGIFQAIFDFIFGKGVITHWVFRKLAHATEYACFAFELCCLYHVIKRFNYKHIFEIASVCLFVSVIDELIQVLSSRGPDVVDVLIDFSGCAFSILLFTLIFTIVKAVRNTKMIKSNQGESNNN